MSDQAQRGWLIVTGLVVVSLLGITVYTLQQNQSFKVTLAEARTALLAAQAARTEAEARALLPNEALAVAALPVVNGAVIRGVDEISPGVYRIWRRVPGEAGPDLIDEWWRSESLSKTAEKIFETTFESEGVEPVAEVAKTVDGGVTIQVSDPLKKADRFVVLTLDNDGHLVHALNVNGLSARLMTQDDDRELRFSLPAAGCPARGNLSLPALEFAADSGEVTTVAIAPPVIIACQAGLPTGSPWTVLTQAAPSPENTTTPGASLVWRLPLTSVGERDRYLELGLTLDPATLFIR